MKRICLLLTSFMLLLTLSGFAASGDVTIRFNGGGADNNKVFTGEDNFLELIITNSNPVKGMSLGFELTNGGLVPFNFVTPYGNKPADPNPKYVQEYGDAVDKFDLGMLMVTTAAMPDSFLLGGAALAQPLPAHATPYKCYDLKMHVDALAGEHLGAFCIDNIFFPPAGSWKFDFGSPAGAIAPTFNGQTNTSSSNPDAPPQCFDLLERPCINPVFTSVPGAAVSKSHCLDYAFDFNATEGGNVPPADPVTFSAVGGSIVTNTGELSVPKKLDCGTTDVTVTAHNACQGSTDYQFTITWTNNDPNITNCPGSLQKVAMGNTYTFAFGVFDADPCDNFNWAVAQTSGPAPAGSFGITGTGVFSFITVNPDDGGNTYGFQVTVTDPCGGTDVCDFEVFVLETIPFIIKIEKTHNSYQGHYEYVSITQEAGSEMMGGFDFLIAYDASALTFFSATLGAGPVANEWEYFTYRYGAYGNCGGPCPSGMLRVVAIADQNNGAHHPIWGSFAVGTELVQLKFYVTNDRTYECMYVPVRFAWFDCGDNAISNIGGDTLWISDKVFEWENTNPLTDPNYEITGVDCAFPLHYGGYCDPACLIGMKYFPVSYIYFWNGGVDIPCADSIDARGDINLNGIANEIADAVMYTNYFLYGYGALPIIGREGSIAASDVNNDGRPLTVADLVYLLRIIVGDALPFPKLAPFANSANVTVVNGVVSTEAATEIGAVYATFAVSGTYSVVNNSTMEVVSAENNGELRVLVFSGTSNLSNRLSAGSNALFTVNGAVELKSVEVSDYAGNLLNTRVSKTALPTAFALQQNVPNPFNPTTKIGLDLPTVSDWSIDIYNVAGQLVKSFNGRGVGNVTVEWNAANVASGIYFYKAKAGSFTDTKKMVLMK